jgi:hypothetical protein
VTFVVWRESTAPAPPGANGELAAAAAPTPMEPAR